MKALMRAPSARGEVPRTLLLALSAMLLATAASAVLSALSPARAGAAPSDLGYQWGLTAIGAPQAWSSGTGQGVRIGIVDTGVDQSQVDLQGKVVAATTILSNPSAGCAGAAQDPNGSDDYGHGTHVAGIAAASGRSSVSGVAPGASLVVAKVLDCTGTGNTQDVENGILWVAAHGAQVINLSLGDSVAIIGSADPLNQAIQEAWDQYHAISVIAAGNNSNGILGLGLSNTDFSNDPAVVVAATGPSGAIASYSNTVTSAKWGIAAPGGDNPNGPTTPTCGTNDPTEILSTYWTAQNPVSCVASDEGTSMATPFVSGTLALLLGRGLSPVQAIDTLLGSASHPAALSASGGCGVDCSGFLDTSAAVASANTQVANQDAASGNGAGGSSSTGQAGAQGGSASRAPNTSPGGQTGAGQAGNSSLASGSGAGASGASGASGSSGASGASGSSGASSPSGATRGGANPQARSLSALGRAAANKGLDPLLITLLIVAGVAGLAVLGEMARRLLVQSPADGPPFHDT